MNRRRTDPVKAVPLRPGGTIGVAGTSSPWEQRSDVDRGVRWWESKGYRVKLAEGVFERDAYLAGDPETRAKDLVAMFEDPEVDAVQSLGGGTGASQVVPLLDLDVVAANPKPFIGYSDVTALHVAIRQATGLVTFYGPGFMGVGDAERGEFSVDRLLTALTWAEPLGTIPARPDDPYVGALNGGTATAPLVGGCLSLLRETLATGWEIDCEGAILFFEDVYVPASDVDGMLTHLANAGKLERVAGVVIGEMSKCQDELFPGRWLQSRSMEDVFEAHFKRLGVPVVFNLPLGHGKHLATLPLGVTATVDADARTVTIDEPALDARPGARPRT
jgi:muramoyltetrapeptide carboxypeptidase